MKVLIPAIFVKPVFRADKSVKLEFDTREFSGNEAVVLMDMREQEGWLLFSPNELKEEDIPDEKADAMLGKKTQAQRLRGVIFKLWEAKGKQGDFETFYTAQMEKIIDFIKGKIDE